MISASIATEPLGLNNAYQPAPTASANPATRSIEATESVSPDKHQDPSTGKDNAQAQKAAAPPEASDRPPGKDRSIPPQTLEDAELIGEQFKASIVADEQQAKATETESQAPGQESVQRKESSQGNIQGNVIDAAQPENDSEAVHAKEVVRVEETKNDNELKSDAFDAQAETVEQQRVPIHEPIDITV